MPTIAIPGRWPETRPRCREKKGPAGTSSPAPAAKDQLASTPEEAVLCRACRTSVTTRREAVSVNGTHIHTFFNPAGLVFEICCFRRAGGCAVHGEPSSEFAWFAGSRWQYAVCVACQRHLGWYFVTPNESFFGLIRNRLFMKGE